MKEATKRAILRWVHLVFGLIPILGYVYSPFDKIPSYASLTRYGFVPILILSGYWMYAGMIFGLIGTALWLTAVRFYGYAPALLTQIALFIGWKVWTAMRKQRSA